MVRVEEKDGVVMVEIYFDDLKEEAQRALLEAYGISDPKEMNWDVFPIDTIETCEEG